MMDLVMEIDMIYHFSIYFNFLILFAFSSYPEILAPSLILSSNIA